MPVSGAVGCLLRVIVKQEHGNNHCAEHCAYQQQDNSNHNRHCAAPFPVGVYLFETHPCIIAIDKRRL